MIQATRTTAPIETKVVQLTMDETTAKVLAAILTRVGGTGELATYAYEIKNELQNLGFRNQWISADAIDKAESYIRFKSAQVSDIN